MNEIERLKGELENAVHKHARLMLEFEKCDIELENMRNNFFPVMSKSQELQKMLVDLGITNNAEKSIHEQIQELKISKVALMTATNENIKLKDDLERAIIGELILLIFYLFRKLPSFLHADAFDHKDYSDLVNSQQEEKERHDMEIKSLRDHYEFTITKQMDNLAAVIEVRFFSFCSIQMW